MIKGRLLLGGPTQREWILPNYNLIRSKELENGEEQYNSLYISPDGTKLFYRRYMNNYNQLRRFDMSVPWDISTAVHVGDFENLQNSGPVFFKPDGTWLLTHEGGYINTYSVTPAWDMAGVSFLAGDYDYSSGRARSIFIRDDGMKYYFFGRSSLNVENQLYEYNGNGFSSYPSYDRVSTLYSPLGYGNGLFFSPDGKKMFVLDISPQLIHSYTLTTPWSTASIVYDNKTLNCAFVANPCGIFFSPDGQYLYILGMSYMSVKIHQLSI